MSAAVGRRTADPSRVAASAARRIDVRVLGTFAVAIDGVRVSDEAWIRRSAQRLVKLLAVSPRHCLSREAAGETLWPEVPPFASAANLRKAIHFARSALGSTALLGNGRLVGFEPSLVAVDLDGLETMLGSSAVPDSDRKAALELGSLELLPDDAYEDWLIGPRERIRERWRRVAIAAAHDGLRHGQPEYAHRIGELLIERDPFDEEGHRLVIEAHGARGRRVDAIRQFDTCRNLLVNGLGVEPSRALFDAYRRALVGNGTNSRVGVSEALQMLSAVAGSLGWQVQLRTPQGSDDAMRLAPGTGPALATLPRHPERGRNGGRASSDHPDRLLIVSRQDLAPLPS